MFDNIFKSLYIGVGALILVVALSVFLNYENKLYSFDKSYNQLENNSWMIPLNESIRSTEVILATGIDEISDSIVMTGEELEENFIGILLNDSEKLLGLEVLFDEESMDISESLINLEASKRYVYSFRGQVITVDTR